MLTDPEIVERESLPYAYIAFSVPMSEIASAAPDGFSRFFNLLDAAGIEPAGPAFMNYRRMNMAGSIDFEIGAEVEAAGDGAHGLSFGILPGGAYGRLVWTGPYDKLVDANAALISWAEAEGIAWDSEQTSEGEVFACRLEIYETGPMDDPDPQTWTTEVAIKIG